MVSPVVDIPTCANTALTIIKHGSTYYLIIGTAMKLIARFLHSLQ